MSGDRIPRSSNRPQREASVAASDVDIEEDEAGSSGEGNRETLEVNNAQDDESFPEREHVDPEDEIRPATLVKTRRVAEDLEEGTPVKTGRTAVAVQHCRGCRPVASTSLESPGVGSRGKVASTENNSTSVRRISNIGTSVLTSGRGDGLPSSPSAVVPAARRVEVISEIRRDITALKKMGEETRREIAVMRDLGDDVRSMMEKVDGLLSSGRRADCVQKDRKKWKVGKKKGADDNVTAKDQYEQVMEEYTSGVLKYFHPALMSSAVWKCTVDKILEARSGQILEEEGFYSALQAMFFSLRNNQRKTEYKTMTGLAASRYRKNILKCALSLAQGGELPPPEMAAVERDVGVAHLPCWLGKVRSDEWYISDDHIVAAQLRHESTQTGTPAYHRRIAIGSGLRPERKDIAEYVMYCVYKLLNEHFLTVRKQAAVDFCETLGYLFIDWKAFKDVRVSDDTLTMQWAEGGDHKKLLRLDDVPKTIVSRKMKQKEVGQNGELYRSGVGSWPELVLYVTHDALVKVANARKTKGVRQSSGVVPERFARAISLLDAASAFLSGWAGFHPPLDYAHALCHHDCSLMALYAVATVLRTVLDHNPIRSIWDGNGKKVAAAQYDDEKKVRMLHEILKMMSPCESNAARAVVRATCTISRQFFEENRLRNDDEDGGTSATPYGEETAEDLRREGRRGRDGECYEDEFNEGEDEVEGEKGPSPGRRDLISNDVPVVIEDNCGLEWKGNNKEVNDESDEEGCCEKGMTDGEEKREAEDPSGRVRLVPLSMRDDSPKLKKRGSLPRTRKSKKFDVRTTGSGRLDDEGHDDEVQAAPSRSGSTAARVEDSCDTPDRGLERGQLGDGDEGVSEAETLDEPVFPMFRRSPRRASRASQAS